MNPTEPLEIYMSKLLQLVDLGQDYPMDQLCAFEEVKQQLIQSVDLSKTSKQCQLISGDILILQKKSIFRFN